MNRIARIVSAVVVATGFVAATSAEATTFTATGTGANAGLAASADFEINGNQLVITLLNTSSADVLVPNQVLTALFFDTTPDTTLTPVSAALSAGSQTFFGPNVSNVGGEWAYAHNISNAPGGGAEQGTSSTGLGLFGGGNFGGSNLQGPVSVDGLQYGLTSQGDNLSTGNTAVTGQFALTQYGVVLTLTMNPAYPSLNYSNVRFLYGTALDGPLLYGTPSNDTPPTPDGSSTMMLLGSALGALGLLRRKFGRI